MGIGSRPCAAYPHSRACQTILLVEGDPDDALLIRRALAAAADYDEAGQYEIICADRLAVAAERLAESPIDVVLLDLTLPDSRGLATLAAIRAQAPDVAVVVVTGHDDEVLALKALREGAQDYLVKGQWHSTLLARSLRYAVERKRSDVARRQSEERFRRLVETAHEGVWTIDARGVTDYVNARMAGLLGYTPEEMLGRLLSDFVHDEMSEEVEQRLARRRAGMSEVVECRFRRKDGGDIWALLATNSLVDDRGAYVGALAMVTDITERRRSEEALRASERQLRQAQKMEAIGRLAGGVAHDFNNILMVITTYTAMLREEPQLPASAAADIAEIGRAADRAAALTRQLLAFSRQQVVHPQVLDLNVLVTDIERMLRRLIGEDILFGTALTTDVLRVKADQGQLEQVLMNLVVNARDAMPDGGRLTITTARLVADDAFVRAYPHVQAGRYARLTVADTGCGMDQETLARVFEPFFTTKELGKGTGLGLSTVYGIVEQAGGHVWCSSAPGNGAVFEVILPEVDERCDRHSTAVTAVQARGGATILVVEDDEPVRKVILRILERRGYTVLHAAHGADAIHLSERHDGPIHLVLTDMIMPEMSGRELGERVARRHAGVKIIYMSGYTDDEIVRRGIVGRHGAFLQKPFTSEVLEQAVRDVLHGEGRDGERAE